MRLRIDNQTRWDTRDLRRFILAALRHKGAGDRHVSIGYGKHGDVGGWGSYPDNRREASDRRRGCREGATMRLTLPGPGWVAAHERDPIDLRQLAQLLEHEIDHTLGLTHDDMLDWWTLEPTWHKDLIVRWRTPNQCESAVVMRERHARAMLAKADERIEKRKTQLRIAKTARTKWAKKVAYYDRKEAA